MSRAFVKETDELPALPERVISPHPNFVTPSGLQQIEEQVQTLEEERTAARNADDRARLAIQVFATAIALAGTGLTVMSQQALDWANDIDDDNVAAAWAGLMLIVSMVATIGILWLLPVRDEQQL